MTLSGVVVGVNPGVFQSTLSGSLPKASASMSTTSWVTLACDPKETMSTSFAASKNVAFSPFSRVRQEFMVSNAAFKNAAFSVVEWMVATVREGGMHRQRKRDAPSEKDGCTGREEGAHNPREARYLMARMLTINSVTHC
jgi:hypothetical protein